MKKRLSHEVPIDILPCDASVDSGDNVGDDDPKGESGLVRNIIILEGSATVVHQVIGNFQREFPSAAIETPEDALRHRELLRIETDGLPLNVPDGSVTVALRFETLPPPNPTTVANSAIIVKAITDRWRQDLIIGHIYFDQRPVDSAIGMITCNGPKTGDASRGTIGSRGGNREAYFRIKQHFYDDYASFFRDVVTESAEAQVRYPYRREWSTTRSPLRIQFLTEDPARNGWSLAVGSRSAESSNAFIVKGGFLPPKGVSVTVSTRWTVGLAILDEATKRGIYPFFDPDGQMMISGYALHKAGLIDASLKPILALDIASNLDATQGPMAVFLTLYAQSLGHAIHELLTKGGSDDQIWRLSRHRIDALDWLVSNLAPPAQPAPQNPQVIGQQLPFWEGAAEVRKP